jgi:hypothetical protein
MGYFGNSRLSQYYERGEFGENPVMGLEVFRGESVPLERSNCHGVKLGFTL